MDLWRTRVSQGKSVLLAEPQNLLIYLNCVVRLVNSSTVLASTGSLFTFLFAVMVKDEGFGYVKLAGVILGVVGSCLTALHDSSSDDGSSTGTRPVLGDILGLISAIGYGAYAVQTRVLCPRDESLYSMQLILGYIGLVTMVALSPVAAYIVLYKVELPMVVLGFLMIKGKRGIETFPSMCEPTDNSSCLVVRLF